MLRELIALRIITKTKKELKNVSQGSPHLKSNITWENENEQKIQEYTLLLTAFN